GSNEVMPRTNTHSHARRAKKKDPPAQNRKADEIYLRPQKNAPLPTRKWLYGLYFLPIAKSLFLE
ncbi:MAG: hypothetical protein J6N18_05515, partial [Kiritimatiellae bacterium]|nr:hypothetical protein [Kiritimatiellia bacterium]